MPDGEEGLRHILLRREIHARGRLRAHWRKRRNGRLLIGPAREKFFELALHFRGGEIAADGEHDIRREEVALVERDQILAAYAIDVLVLLAPAVGIVAAVDRLG